MGMDISWALNQTVRWEQATGELNQHAQPIRADRGEIPARLARKTQLVRSADGREVVSHAQLHTRQQIGLLDLVTFEGRPYRPVNTGAGLGLYDAEPVFYVTYL